MDKSHVHKLIGSLKELFRVGESMFTILDLSHQKLKMYSVHPIHSPWQQHGNVCR